MNNDIEWKMVKLGDIATFLPTNTLSRDELNYSEGKYLDIHYGDVLIKLDSVTNVLDSDIPFVSGNKEFSQKSLLQNGDIVMADTAEDESVGKVTEVQNIGNCKVVSGLHTMCMRFQENLFAPNFAGYYFNSPSFHNLLLPYMHGTKVTSISKGDVKKVIFPIPYKNGSPDLETQSLIAQKLGDMDSLISAKEKLLAKKRNLKTAAMQKLIKDDWNFVEFEKLCIPGKIIRGPFGGSLKKEMFVKRGYQVYEQTNAIYQTLKGKYFIDEEKYKELFRFSVNPGDFIISCSGTIGKIYEIPKNAPKGVINQALLKITLNENLIDKKFFYFYFCSNNFQLKILDGTQGGAMQNLVGMAEFKKTLFPLPDLTEQKRIATILSDMDSDISAIEKEISKLQNLKTAMMQKMFCFSKEDE